MIHPKNKKIIIIITIVTILGLGFYFIWKNYFCIGTNYLQSKIFKVQVNSEMLYNDRIYFPYLINNKKIIFLADLGRYFFEFNPETKETKKILNEEVLEPTQIYYSNSGIKTIVRSNYPFPNISLYDFQSKNIETLDNNIQDLVWSNDDKKIYYIYSKFDDNSKNLVVSVNVSDPNGQNWQKLFDIDPNYIKNNHELELSADSNRLFVYNNSIITKKIQIISYNLQSKQKEENEIEKNVISLFINKTGDKLIYNQIANIWNSYPIGIYDLKNKKDNTLKESQYIENGIWLNNNQDFVFTDRTSLEKINADTLKIEAISLSDQNILEFHNLMVDPEDKYLYFTNEMDWLYRIPLNK